MTMEEVWQLCRDLEQLRRQQKNGPFLEFSYGFGQLLFESYINIKFFVCLSLKVATNEKQGGSGKRQMIDTDLGTW